MVEVVVEVERVVVEVMVQLEVEEGWSWYTDLICIIYKTYL